jgi:hypothetical protein
MWHLPDHFAEEGWGVEALIAAPNHVRHRVRLAVFRPCLVCVVLQRDSQQRVAVAIFHASFDASISQLSRDVVSASNPTRFLIFSGVIVLAAHHRDHRYQRSARRSSQSLRLAM